MKPERENNEVQPKTVKQYELKKGSSKTSGSALNPRDSFTQLRQSSKILPEEFEEEEEPKNSKGNRFSRQTDPDSIRRSRSRGKVFEK